jgi:hypothetical protein
MAWCNAQVMKEIVRHAVSPADLLSDAQELVRDFPAKWYIRLLQANLKAREARSSEQVWRTATDC